MAAYRRFPDLRLHIGEDGEKDGNIIVTSQGKQHPLDDHPTKSFANRIKHYVVGRNPVVLTSPHEIRKAREETLDMIRFLTAKAGNTPFAILGRGGIRLDETQIRDLIQWMESLKQQQ